MHHIKKLVYAALCLALALYLPFLTGQNYLLGQMLCLMHIPALLCGFICGWQYGLTVGFIAPLLRHMVFSAPPMPTALSMAFELAAYGFVAAILYRTLPKKVGYIYISLCGAMLGGRAVMGIANIIILGINGTSYAFDVFLNSAFATAALGIALHILLIPPIIFALKKAKLLP